MAKNKLSPIRINDSFKNLSNVNITFLLRRDDFSPTIKWAKEKVILSLKSIGNRYITYNKSEYKSLNTKVNLHDLFESISNTNEFKHDSFLEILIVDSNFENAWEYIHEGYGVQYYHNLYKDNKKYLVEDESKETLFELYYQKKITVDDETIIASTYSNLSELIHLILSFYLTYEKLFKQFSDIDFIKKNFFSIKTREIIQRLDILYDEILSHPDAKLVERYLDMSSLYAVEKIWKILRRMTSIKTYIIIEFKKIIFENIYKELYHLNPNNHLLTYLFKYSLISGEAMSGKTHFLSDIANIRINSNKPTILIYAQKFDNNDRPIQQIIKQLHLEQYQYTDKEFLELLNEWGKRNNELVFLIIDAINETPNKTVWRNYFIEFVSMIKEYPYIALIMSIRDVEKRVIFTQDIENYIQSNMIEVEHQGFREIEYPVLKKFCGVFDINLPNFPLTSPLLANPGLMFLFFETLKRKNIVDIDEQVLKPNFIIEEYIKDRNKHFKEMNHILDRGTYIHKGTNVVASKIVLTDFIEKVKYDDISNNMSQIHNQLLEYLISEGILLEQLSNLDEVYLYFSYQRFGNYFIALYLLSVNFEENKKIIYSLLSNYLEHQALVEALIIRFSESEGKDFIDIFPDLFENKELNSIRYQCFSKSLRLPSDIERKITNFITLELDEKYEILELLLSFVYEKGNKLNIDKVLHPLLLSLSLSERDYHWSIYLHQSFVDNGIVKHIINWAWKKEQEYEVENESLYLYGLTLGWFLTSSNRELRDGATKALVNLFTDSVDIFLKVLKEFETVDDLYVLERLYAVGYGIVLRSSNQNGFKELGEYVYQAIFDKDEVIEHILLRDYAKFTVEYIDKSMGLDIDLEKIYPPYNQDVEWELSEITKEEVEKYRDDFLSVYASSLNGDFKIYKVYPLVNHFLNLKIKDRPHPKMPEVRHDEFFDSLTKEQTEEYDKTRLQSNELLALINNLTHEEFEEEITIPELDSSSIDSLRETKLKQSNFKELLSSEQLKEYNDFIVNYKPSGSRETGIKVKYVKRLVFLEAIKLGWDKELFEQFDRNANNGRGTDRGTERIGKKYQWIALYKVLSKLTDNYEFREESYGEKIVDYKGIYQFSFKRDIDPTTILKSKYNTENESWLHIEKSFENLDISDIEWMSSTDKLPTVKQLVSLKREDRKSLALHLSFSIDGHKEGNNYRNLYYNVDSFVIKKDCIESFMDWLGTVNYYGQNKLPQASSMHDMYLREYPDSDVFKHLDTYYHGQVDWEDEFNHSEGVMPCKILLTSTSYMNEGRSYDKSVDETIEVALPNKWFVTEMDLKQTLVDGEWKNKQDEVVFYDPTIEAGSISPYNGNGSLVADKKLLMEFLESNGYSLVWIMWGEKQVRSSGDGFNDDEFLGIAEISGYGYFNDDEFVEDMNINFKERD